MKYVVILVLTVLLATPAMTQPAGENLAISEPRYLPLEKTIYYKLGDNRTIPVKLIRYGPVNRIFCFNLHDNEFTSVVAARSALETRGGTLLKIENDSERVIRFRLRGLSYAFDPNRIFSREGIGQSLRENGRTSQLAIDEVEKFGQRLLALIPDSIGCLIALHNNSEGGYSVNSYLAGGDRQQDARDVRAVKEQDPDDIVFTTDRDIFENMAAAGFNSILQDNEKAKQDGSLSVFFGMKNRRYVNIETQHGRSGQYQQMLEKLLDFLAPAGKTETVSIAEREN